MIVRITELREGGKNERVGACSHRLRLRRFLFFTTIDCSSCEKKSIQEKIWEEEFHLL